MNQFTCVEYLHCLPQIALANCRYMQCVYFNVFQCCLIKLLLLFAVVVVHIYIIIHTSSGVSVTNFCPAITRLSMACLICWALGTKSGNGTPSLCAASLSKINCDTFKRTNIYYRYQPNIQRPLNLVEISKLPLLRPGLIHLRSGLQEGLETEGLLLIRGRL